MSSNIFNLADLTSEYYSMIRGSLVLFFLYHLIIYYLNKNKIYLYYAFYSFFLYTFLLSHVLADETYRFYYYTDKSFQLIAVSFYFLFTRKIVQTKENIYKWDKVLLKVIPALWIFAAILIFTVVFFNKKAQEVLFLAMIFSAITLTIITSLKLIKIDKYHVKLFIFGSLTFLMMLFITLTISMFMNGRFIIKPGFHPMFFLYTGIFVEFIVFAVLISYRYREMIDEKIRIDYAIIKNKIESTELKMMTLKSQLNPIFIFNNLNTINNFVLKNQIEEASDFITKFSRFVRNVLNNSIQTTITLHEELVNLKNYIALEKIRTNSGFEFIEVISPNINTTTTRVLPIILQPYVENAIWHGISQNKGPKKIWLYIDEDQDKLTFTIVDNGIGINKSIEQNRLNIRKMAGTSTDSAQFRINNVFNKKSVTIRRKDLTSEGTFGTEVYISFPKIN